MMMITSDPEKIIRALRICMPAYEGILQLWPIPYIKIQIRKEGQSEDDWCANDTRRVSALGAYHELHKSLIRMARAGADLEGTDGLIRQCDQAPEWSASTGCKIFREAKQILSWIDDGKELPRPEELWELIAGSVTAKEMLASSF